MGSVARSEAVASLPVVPVRADVRTLEILRRRRAVGRKATRGWFVRRLLASADVLAILIAFAAVQFVGGQPFSGVATLTFVLCLPGWVLLAKLYGLYDHDDERTYHTTIDEFGGIFHLVTIGTCFLVAVGWVTTHVAPQTGPTLAFWAAALVLVPCARMAARRVSRSSLRYLQNTVIVGAGDVGQLVARKIQQHPEYGINLIGFVDATPKTRRPGVDQVPMMGVPEDLATLVEAYDVERVIVAFSRETSEATVEVIRRLNERDIQIDIVPRLFELVGTTVDMHTIEGLPLVGLPPARPNRSSRLIKRTIDLIGASIGLVVAAPLFAYAAWRIPRESPGPVLFRQDRVGLHEQEFSCLKFRTMRSDIDQTVHREYVRRTMNSDVAPNENGLFKLNRDDAITPFGRFLRRTSLDEVPQLINVLRGDMSLVGPRPCLRYETEHFEHYHFDRFQVPPGLTGLWQVTARANSTFGEALDMDVAYAHGWSLGLDLRLLFLTPLQVLKRSTA